MLPPELVEMREIAPNVVIETHVNRLEGVALRPDGKPYPDDGNLITMVFVKSGGAWRIAHAHNGHIDKQAAAYDPAKEPSQD
jgi:ketosteroid isomerase-like protein